MFEQTASDTLTLTGSLEAGESPTALARGDFNHDGQEDLAIINQGDNTLGIFLQAGGTLGAMSSYNTQDSPDSLAVGDFNGDLRDDVAVSHANSQSFAIYHQQEDATLAEAISHDVRSGGFNTLASGDLNSDGMTIWYSCVARDHKRIKYTSFTNKQGD